MISTTTRHAIRRIRGFPRRVIITRRNGKERIRIADKWQGLSRGIPDSYFNKREVRRGMRVEREHTPKEWMQRNIAQDHLTEDESYYRKLAKMEKKGGK